VSFLSNVIEGPHGNPFFFCSRLFSMMKTESFFFCKDYDVCAYHIIVHALTTIKVLSNVGTFFLAFFFLSLPTNNGTIASFTDIYRFMHEFGADGCVCCLHARMVFHVFYV
jgi:hypothetical protein